MYNHTLHLDWDSVALRPVTCLTPIIMNQLFSGCFLRKDDVSSSGIAPDPATTEDTRLQKLRLVTLKATPGVKTPGRVLEEHLSLPPLTNLQS